MNNEIFKEGHPESAVTSAQSALGLSGGVVYFNLWSSEEVENKSASFYSYMPNFSGSSTGFRYGSPNAICIEK